jgi:hypothetical protein
MLEAFRTEIRGMTAKTCSKQQQLARDEMGKEYLNIKKDGTAGDSKRIVLFGAKGDERWMEAMK